MNLTLLVKSISSPVKSIVLAAFSCLIGIGFANPITAQVTIATGLPASASSGASAAPSVITFCIQNSNPSAVTLTGIDNYMSSTNSNTVWTLLYSATSLSGQPNVTTWTSIATVTGPVTTTTGIFPLFSGLSFSIPANTTYRFALQTTAGQINYGPAGTIPNSVTVSNVSLFRGDYLLSSLAVGYAGTASAPPFNPRFFCGTLYLNTAPPCTGAPGTPLITTAAMTTPICTGTGKNITATNTNAPATVSYQWQQSASATGPWVAAVGGTGATTLSYTTATTLTANTWFRLRSSCGTASDSSAPYQVPVIAPPQVGAITGTSTNVCINTSRVYRVTPVAGATSYNWTLPSGWSGASTVDSIVATVNGPGTVSVSAVGACGSGNTQSLTVSTIATPVQPGPITGNSIVCANTQQTYLIPAVPTAATYTWTKPTGWTGTSTGTTLITTTTSNPGVVSVTASNACGTSSPRTLGVTLTTLPPVLGAITGPASVCGGSIQNYTVAPVPNVLSYTWSLPAGWAGTSNGNAILATAPTASGAGTVSVVASNGCGTPTPVTLPVTVNAVAPTSATISPSSTSTSVCEGVPVTFSAVTTGSGNAPLFNWTRNNSTQIGIAGPSFTVNDLTNGDIIGLTMTSSAACATPPTVVATPLTMTVLPNTTTGININMQFPSAPVICSGTPLVFTSNIVGGGGNPTFQWFRNGSTTGATGPSYTGSGWMNGDVVTAKLTSNAQCASPAVATSNPITITVAPPAVPTVFVTASPSNVFTPGIPLTFTANSTAAGPAPLFQWFRNGQIIIGATNPVYTTVTLTGGDTISVRMTSSDPCAIVSVVFSDRIVVQLSSTSVAGVAGTGAGIEVYPNPSKGRFTVRLAGGKTGVRTGIEILNALGQRVYFREVLSEKGDWTIPVELRGVASGPYLLRLRDEAGGNAVLRFEVAE